MSSIKNQQGFIIGDVLIFSSCFGRKATRGEQIDLASERTCRHPVSRAFTTNAGVDSEANDIRLRGERKQT
jgi:hypothetical protein